MDIFDQIIEMKWEDGIRTGLRKGKRVAREEVVRELLAKTEFSDAKIASLTKVTVLQVARIRKKLQVK
ncbi:MAG TPA: hypothetical protein VGS79_16790 [Puia sp.]|nr:hypothetical protein [Puia sp.]